METNNGLSVVQKNLEAIRNDLIEVVFLMEEDGTLIRLSKFTMYVLELYIRFGGKWKIIDSKCREKYKIGVNRRKLEKILNYPDTQKYLDRRLKELGLTNTITKDVWLMQAMEYRDGKKNSDENTRFFHKLIGQAKGYLEEGQHVNQTNISIDFRQSDGQS